MDSRHSATWKNIQSSLKETRSQSPQEYICGCPGVPKPIQAKPRAAINAPGVQAAWFLEAGCPPAPHPWAPELRLERQTGPSLVIRVGSQAWYKTHQGPSLGSQENEGVKNEIWAEKDKEVMAVERFQELLWKVRMLHHFALWSAYMGRLEGGLSSKYSAMNFVSLNSESKSPT